MGYTFTEFGGIEDELAPASIDKLTEVMRSLAERHVDRSNHLRLRYCDAGLAKLMTGVAIQDLGEDINQIKPAIESWRYQLPNKISLYHIWARLPRRSRPGMARAYSIDCVYDPSPDLEQDDQAIDIRRMRATQWIDEATEHSIKSAPKEETAQLVLDGLLVAFDKFSNMYARTKSHDLGWSTAETGNGIPPIFQPDYQLTV